MPTENAKNKRASSVAALKTVPSRICTKYEKVYEDGPNQKRVIYIKKKSSENQRTPYDTKSISPSICNFLKDYTEAASICSKHQRLRGDKQAAQIVNIMPSLTVCNEQHNRESKIVKAPFSQSCVQPSVVHVQMKDVPIHRNWERFANCICSSDKKRPHKINRGTQTLYRESSAQTLPYLPEIANDKETLETLELFKLPKILKGDGPPGLYEVEILERARKRWAFEKAIKREFECKMKEARTELARKKHFMKHKHVIEAFEWEHWLQREEAIQSYQMMRFKLVICIFEKREREMHQSSNLRISLACEQIAAKRDKELKKNEIEYGRQLRRMKIEHERKPRNWRKEKISDQLGDPSSEYYGPQMRYGVNPNRRHFQSSRKAFEMRMEDLEKRAVNMKNLECPFAKLKEWSKPKEQKPEIEQNFCTDTNLKKLYESLKGLRELSKKQKIIPKCLKEKVKQVEHLQVDVDEITIEEFEFESDIEDYSVDVGDEAVQAGPSFSQNSLMEMYSQRDSSVVGLAELLDERRREELEMLLAEYEGTKIGWLMRFLSEEMGRLQEQRKLHFITMLAQKERWRREAAEAGLRQKENEMRRIYEEIFDEIDQANADVCEQYLDNIFGIDTREQADFEAVNTITGLAKIIDSDLQRWLSSFKLIQHPLNYDDLRCLLRDLVFPDNLLECLVRQYEAKSVVDYVINDVLFPNIYTLLEPFDVVSPLTNDMIDRLIDNDLYLFSSECSSSCDCYDVCDCTAADLEAKAIMRKVIRQAVPGRRWRTSTERIADESARDIIDMVCGKVDTVKHCTFLTSPHQGRQRKTIRRVTSELDLFAPRTASTQAFEMNRLSEETTADSSRIDTVTIVKYRKRKDARDSVTRSLTPIRHHERSTFPADTIVTSESVLLAYKKLKSPRVSASTDFRPSLLKEIPSALNLLTEDLDKAGDAGVESTESSEEFITRTHKHERRLSQSFVRAICNDLVENIIRADEIYGDAVVEETASATSTEKVLTENSDEDITSTVLETEQTTKYDETDDFKVETDIEPSTSEHVMVLYEGELKRILQEDDECKCQIEIDRRNHIKELYESGKIKIIYKEPKTVEDEEALRAESETLNVDLSEMVFEYATTSRGEATTTYDQSYYHFIVGEDLGEDLAEVLTEEFEDVEQITRTGVEMQDEMETNKFDETVLVVIPREELPTETEVTAEVDEGIEYDTVQTENNDPVAGDNVERVHQPISEEIADAAELDGEPELADFTATAETAETAETATVNVESPEEVVPADDVVVDENVTAGGADENPQENVNETVPKAENEATAEK